jgi:hypothetical protein
MTSPGGVERARVSVRVLPDTSRFSAELLADLKKIEAKTVVTLRTALDGTGARRDAAQLRRLIEGTGSVEWKTKVDTTGAVAQVEATRRLLNRRSIDLRLGIDRQSIQQVSAQVLKLGAAISAAGLGALAGTAVTGGVLALGAAIAQAAGAVALLPAAGAAGAAALGAVAVGFEGVGDAIKNAGDPEKFAEALKHLSPAAREAAKAVKELGPELHDLRLDVQDRLFEGIADTIGTLGGKYIPVLRKGLAGTAAELNAGARAWADFAGSARSVADTDILFHNLNQTWHELIPVGALLGQAFRDIAVVGSDFLPQLGGAFTDAADRFAQFIAESRKSGALQQFISDALVAFRDLGSIIGNIGSLLGSVFSAANTHGAGLLATVKNLTGQMAAWAKSTEGQNALGQLFESARKAADALMPILTAVFEVLATQVAPILAEVGAAVGPAVVQVVRAIGSALEAARPGIIAFAQGFASFLEALAPALPAVGALASAIGTTLGTVLTRLGPVLADVVETLSNALAEALSNPDLIDGLVAMGQAFGDLVTALAPVIPPLAEMAGTILKGLAKVVSTLAPVIGDLASAFADALAPVLPDLVNAFVDLAKAFAPIAKDLGLALIKIFEALAPILPPLIRAFADFLKVITPIIDVIAGIISVIADVIGWFADLVDAAVSGVEALFGFSDATEKSIFKDSNVVKSWSKDTTGALGNVSDASKLTGGSLQKMSGEGGFWFGSLAQSAEDSYGRIQRGGNDYQKQVEQSLIPAFTRMRDAGSKSFWDIATAAAGASDSSVNETRKLAERARMELEKADFADQGRRLGRSFADGISASVASVVSAAKQLVNAVDNFLPHSPAKVGPFSGHGWTPYRGKALAEGFAAGITSRVADVRAAASQLVDAASGELPVAVSGSGSAGSGGGATFNIQTQPGQSEVAVAEMVSRRVAWNSRLVTS